MPPDTLWTGNPNLAITVAEGNIACDDTSTLCDSSTTYVDGTTPANLVTIYTPKLTQWTVGKV